MESIDAALDLEGVGTSWLDSVDHLLIKYPNGSRTESFLGLFGVGILNIKI